MHDLYQNFHYDDLWKIINQPDKFELISYLALTIHYPDIKWYMTPKTRDHKHDGEAHGNDQKIYLEAKYIYNYERKKLSHKEVGSNINIAIYDLVDALWIFTNGEIRLDLITFIESHNEFQEIILNKPLKIYVLDQLKSAMFILRNSLSDYIGKLCEIEFIGYKTKSSKQISLMRENTITEGTKLVRSINNLMQGKKEDFYYYPTLAKLKLSENANNYNQEVIRKFFDISSYYDTSIAGQGLQTTKIPIRTTVFLILRVNNNFYENIPFRIKLTPKGVVKFVTPLQREGMDYYFEAQILPFGDKVYQIEFRVERMPFYGIETSCKVDLYELNFSPGKIEFYNPFFLAPFIGEMNNKMLASYKEKIDRAFYKKTVLVGLITGSAGVGKSRFIDEIIDHSHQYASKVFRLELVAKEGKNSIIREFLSQIIGLNSISFISSREQLINRFKYDDYYASLFSNEDESLRFIKTFNEVFSTDFDKISYSQIDKIAQFTYKILYKISNKYFPVIVFEDLHLGNKRIFRFLLQLYNILKINKANIVLLFAARTEAKEYNKDFDTFRSIISNDPTYSIIQSEILPLTDKDSLQLVKEIVNTETKFDEIIKKKVLSKTGNNPFNIIHTLLFLKNAGIIIERLNDYEWHQVNRLEEITIHVEIEKLLRDRFVFYFNLIKTGEKLKILIKILCIFEGKVTIDSLTEIWKDKILFDLIEFLTEERIIKRDKTFIQFDHENISQFVQKNILTEMEFEGNLIFKWGTKKKLIRAYPDLFIRCMYYCFSLHSKKFFDAACLYLNNLIDEENWKDIIRYGNMIVEKANGSNYLDPSRFFQIKFAVCNAISETIDISLATNYYDKLEAEIEKYLESEELFDVPSKFSCYITLQKAKLFRCDVIIMASFYKKAQQLLKTQLKEIRNFLDNHIIYKNSYELNEIIVWSKNRLAITYRALNETEIALKFFKDSLRLAKKIGHNYYIHHNYYDMGGCVIQNCDIKKAFEYHKRCLKPLAFLPNQINAQIRTQIRTGVYYALLNQTSKAEYELERAIEIAREKDYYWELTRGLINLGNLYLKEDNLSSAQTIYKTCLSYVDINNAESLKLCLYNNLSCLYLQLYNLKKKEYYLRESIRYSLKLMIILKPLFQTDPFYQHSIYEALSILNLFKFKKALNSTEMDPSAKKKFLLEFELNFKRFSHYDPNLNKPKYIELFFKKYSDELEYYIMYMSFS